MPTVSIPSGTVTFLFSDVEGSTKRWERFPVAMAAAIAHHDTLLRSAIESHHGFVFKTVGDAFCAAFTSPSDAIAAAIAAQHALLSADWSAVEGLDVRMALHLGSAEERDSDYFGPTVNRVARLLSAGHGGQVLLSDAVAQVALPLPPDVTLRDLGERRLKDLTAPERIAQLVVPGLPDTFAPLAALDARPHNLPVQPTPLLGRDRELSEVKSQLDAPSVRLLTLTGPGGTGKTRLALQLGADRIDAFAHGVFFVDLGATTDPSLVPSEIATAIGMREEGSDPIATQLLAFLRDKELLLILDNFEQLLPAAKQIATLLGGAPKLKVIATSRAPLRISGEQEFQVPALGLPDLRKLPDPAHLESFPAVELFVQRAQAVNPVFTLDDANAAAVAQICVELDGLPLAIELAAARIRLLAPQAMLPRLGKRLSLLTGGARDKAERQQTIRNTIAWSVDLLPEETKTLFARLAVFPGGCSFDAAEVVCNPDGALDLFDGLAQLVEHSLLRQDDADPAEPRFRQLATIREYALDLLQESGERETVQDAMVDYIVSFVTTVAPGLRVPDPSDSFRRVSLDNDNLRVVMSLHDDPGRRESALAVASKLWPYWDAAGQYSEGRQWLSHLLDPLPTSVSSTDADAMDGAAILADAQADYDEADRWNKQALEAREVLGELRGVATATTRLGQVAAIRGDFDRARELLGQALSTFNQLGDNSGVAVVTLDLGNVFLATGAYSEAQAAYEESLRIFEADHSRVSASFAQENLGGLAIHTEDFARAAEVFTSLLDRYREWGFDSRIPPTQAHLGHAHHRLGSLEEARDLYAAAAQGFIELGDTGGLAFVRSHEGWLLFDLGEIEHAENRHRESINIAHELGEIGTVIESLEGLGALAAHSEDWELAERRLMLAERLRLTYDMPRPTVHQAPFDSALASTAKGLGRPPSEKELSHVEANELPDLLATLM